MNDFDIVISLNPSQPVAGAAKVTQAVAKIETQSKETQKALDAVSLQTKQAQDALAASAEKQTGKMKQGVAATAAAFSVLNEKLKLSESAFGRTILEATKFASIGAQVGGAWGAAIGATVALADSLGTALGIKFKMMTDAIDELEARQRKAGAAVSDATKAIEAQGKALADYSQYASSVNQATHSMAEGFRGLATAASSVPDWLMRVGLGADPWDPNKTKKKLDKIFATDSDSTKSTLSIAEAYRSLRAKSSGAAYGALGKLGSPLRFNSDEAANAMYAEHEANLRDQSPSDLDAELANLEAAKETTLRLAENTRKWNEELVQTNITAQVVSEVLNKAATSFADTLVDAANGADVSWRKWGEDMLVMIEKVIAQALVLKAIGATTGGVGGGGTGLLGLLFGGAHATGGSYTAPATGGGPDSIPVMFRMSPRETATFTPHGQAFGGTAGGGPGAINLTVAPQIHDERAILSAVAGPNGQRVVYNIVRQAMGAVRPLG